MAKNDPLAKIAGKHVILSPDVIDANPANCNRQPKSIFAKLVESIRTFGFVDPLIVREKSGGRYEAIGGEHRLRAAKVLRMPEVPAINVGTMRDATAARLLIVLNETRGQSDHDALAALVNFIKEEDGDEALQVLPYTDAQLADLVDDIDDDVPDDDDAEDAPPEPAVAKIKPSDVAAMFELEGLGQAELKSLIISIRTWRQKKDPETPAHTHLLRLLKADR